ncbi:MAG TPA: serine/threonine-protein kinase [Kofleriaceae bacterium]|nr:serine/threonine-protein kinase [Kofleriaceae bacterium]
MSITLRPDDPATADDPLIGHSLLGRYRVRRFLGAGTMARVYLAHQVSVGREVAVKVLRSELTQDSDAAMRFRREIEAVARLRSPHTIEFFDCGETPSGYHFIVMEYLQGETLRARLDARGALPPGLAISIVAQVASALGEAHAAGIVHRDLKPENIHFTDHPSPLSPFVKVLDFGLVQLADARHGSGRATGKHTTVGTPAYLAPEAATVGQAIDWRCDLYALGVITFQMLTGILPFSGRTPIEAMIAHVRDPIPSAAAMRPELGPAIDGFFAQVLAKDPQQRISNAALLAQSLSEALTAR